MAGEEPMRFKDFIITESTKGPAAWKKYYSKAPVVTLIKNTSKIFNDKGETDSIPKNAEVEIQLVKKYPSKGQVPFKYKGKTYTTHVDNISKPHMDAKTIGKISSLTANSFLKGAPTGTFEWAGEKFPGFFFKSENELQNLVHKNLMSLDVIEQIPSLQQTLEEFFSGDYSEILWGEEVDKKVKKKFGIYFGELLVGLAYLKKAKKLFKGSTENFWPSSKVKYFVIPSSSSTKTIDSLIVLENGLQIPISSKFGVGAAASFIGNVVSLAAQMPFDFKSPVLRSLEKRLEKGMSQRNIVWETVIHDFLNLKLDADKLYKDSMTVVKKKGEPSDDLELLLKKVDKHKWTDKAYSDQIKNTLPDSLSNLFVREITFQIENDKKALDEVLKVLGVKDFYQVSLDEPSWIQENGKTLFKVVSSKTPKVVLDPSKGGNNLERKSGWLSYRLK